MNLKSNLLNISEIARELGTRPSTLRARINGNGRYKPLNSVEIARIRKYVLMELGIGKYTPDRYLIYLGDDKWDVIQDR
jgi:hypothetical protein